MVLKLVKFDRLDPKSFISRFILLAQLQRYSRYVLQALSGYASRAEVCTSSAGGGTHVHEAFPGHSPPVFALLPAIRAGMSTHQGPVLLGMQALRIIV